MSKKSPVPPSPSEPTYLPPLTLRAAHARIKFAARELAGGSVHRTIEVLREGVCTLPTMPHADELDLRYDPPVPKWVPVLPTDLKAADRTIREALGCLERGSLRSALDVLKGRS